MPLVGRASENRIRSVAAPEFQGWPAHGRSAREAGPRPGSALCPRFLVRKWLVGRGLKRRGLQNPPTPGVPAAAPTLPAQAAPAPPFVPVQLPAPASPAGQPKTACGGDEAIEIELTRGGASLKVRWG